MAKYAFVKKDAGIRKLLQSKECLSVMEKAAEGRYGDEFMRPIIGFDRAKVFVYPRRYKR